MKFAKTLVPLLGILFIVAACDAQLGGRDVPAPFKAKIASFRDDQTALQRQRADLQKQIAELDAKCQWDAQQVDITAGEAIRSLGYSTPEYRVNIQTLRIESVRR
jgi:hypothetical protein